MTDASPAETHLAGLNAELLATWAATRNPRTTGRQLSALYRRAAALRQQIAALEAERAQQTAEIAEVLAWLDGEE